MPCSNVNVERIFADLNNIKMKLRNKLHSPTVASFLKFEQAVKHSSDSCFKFQPRPEIKQKMKAHILYQK